METIEILEYKNPTGKQVSLGTILFNLARNGIKYNCTVTLYNKVDTGTADFKLEAEEATIVCETPNNKAREHVKFVKKQITEE